MAGNVVGQAVITIGADGSDFKKDINKDLDSVEKSTLTSAQKIGTSIKGALGAALGAGIGAGVLQFGRDAIRAASDVEQSFGGLDAIFGATAGKVKQWALDAAKNVGLSAASYATLATGLGSQLEGLGEDTDTAAKHVQDIIDRAGDMASVFGGTTSDAVSAFGGVLRGEYDPMQKYVGTLSDAAVESTLTAKGLGGLVGPAREAAKKQVALGIIFDSTKGIAGNYRKELDTTAGATQGLEAESENLKAQIGKELQPVYNDFLKFLNEKLLPSIKNDIIPATSDLAKAVADAATAADGTLEKSFYDSGAAFRKGFTEQDWGAIEQGILDHIGRIGENITGAFSQIGAKLMEVDWLRGFTEKAKAGWDAFSQWMTDHSQPTFLAEWRLRVGENITGAISDLWNGGRAMVEGLWNGAVDGFNTFWHSLSAYLTDYIIDPFKRLFGIQSPSTLMFSFALDIVQGLINGLVQLPGQVGAIFANMLATIQAWGGSILGWLADAWNRAVTAARDGFERLRLAAGERIAALVGEVGQVPGRILGALGDLGGQLWNAAYSAFQRLLDGATSALGNLGSWASGIKDKIVDAVKSVFGINSPSTVMAELGGHMMQGLLNGLLQSPATLMSAVKTIGTAITGGLGGALGWVANLFGGGKVNIGGKLLDADTYGKIMQALGGAWRLFQGSWSTSVAASAGTHAGSGVADLAPTGLSWGAAEAALRAAGLIAWFRNWAGNLHIHLVNPAAAGLSSQAASQVSSFMRGGNGLAYAAGTSSAMPGWGLVGERGPEWMRFRGGETVLPNGRTPGSTFNVTMNVSVDDLDKMSKIGDFVTMLEHARVDARRTPRPAATAGRY